MDGELRTIAPNLVRVASRSRLLYSSAFFGAVDRRSLCRSRPEFCKTNQLFKRSNNETRMGSEWQLGFLHAVAIVVLSSRGFLRLAVHAETEAAARVVKYSKEDIVPVRAKLRFSTLIVLPEDEEILDFTTGDKEFWVINGAHNLCYVHPAQAGIRSNLNLITASGHVYSFLLTEISNQPNVDPISKSSSSPRKARVSRRTPGCAAMSAPARRKPTRRNWKRSAPRRRIKSARRRPSPPSRSTVSAPATQQNSNSIISLDSKGAREPFLVSVIYHDDSFTYIKCGAREKPALYEIKDGKPNLISFQFENGVYIAPKIIDSGYLAIGKKKLPFARHALPRTEESAMNQPNPRGSGKSSQATRPSAEERPVLASHRTGVPDGRHHVADRRQEARRRQEDRLARGSGRGATRSQRKQDPNCRTASSSCSASNWSRRALWPSRLAAWCRPARFATKRSSRAPPVTPRPANRGSHPGRAQQTRLRVAVRFECRSDLPQNSPAPSRAPELRQLRRLRASSPLGPTPHRSPNS
jgi:type IV secretion system protein VirB9